MKGLAWLAAAALRAAAAPGYGEPLSITTGSIYRVGTVTAFLRAPGRMRRSRSPAAS